MAGEVTIVRGGAERIPQLEPLWKALHHHHAAVAPHLAALEETWATGDRIGELESLAVLPEYRSQGVGRALVHSVFEQLRRLDVTHWGVGVISSNADAIRFYERLGTLPFINTYVGVVPAG